MTISTSETKVLQIHSNRLLAHPVPPICCRRQTFHVLNSEFGSAQLWSTCLNWVLHVLLTSEQCLAKAKLYSSWHTAELKYLLDIKDNMTREPSMEWYNIRCHALPNGNTKLISVYTASTLVLFQDFTCDKSTIAAAYMLLAFEKV